MQVFRNLPPPRLHYQRSHVASKLQAEQTLGQWFRWAASLCCVRHSSTSVSAPVGLGGRQPGNYTALTTSPERTACYHTHIDKNTYLHSQRIQITQPHLQIHDIFFSILPLFLLLQTHTHTHTHTHIHAHTAKHKDSIMSRRITMTPT